MVTTLNDALCQIENADRGMEFETVDIRNLNPVGSDALSVDGEEFPLGPHATESLRQFVGFPYQFDQRLQPRTTEIVLDDLWNDKLKASGSTESLLLSRKDGRIESITRGGLVNISNERVLDVLRTSIDGNEFESANVRVLQIDPMPRSRLA